MIKMGLLKKLWEILNEPPNRKKARYLTRQAYFLVEQVGLSGPGLKMLKRDSKGQVRDITNLIRAGDLLEQAIDTDPTYAHAHGEYGHVNLIDEDYDRAEKHTKIAIQLQPNEPKFWNNLAYTYFKKGDLRRAFVSVTVAGIIDPNYASAYLVKADIIQAMGGSQKEVQNLAERARRLYEQTGLRSDGTPLREGEPESFLAMFKK
ncbi:MAG: tetratricopeptide repeat protein [Nanoarchaeota archaeon]|nr:tetratricopeptide repeat protein [Nanoarchaeota archaeon]